MGWLVTVLMVACAWRLFQKASREPWKSLLPVYNVVVLFRIAEQPTWHAVVAFAAPVLAGVVPVVVSDLVVAMIISCGLLAVAGALWQTSCLGLAERFDRSLSFALGLAVLPAVFFPILAFGAARYRMRSTGTDEVLGLH